MLRRTADVEVVALFTTFNGAADRVAMHAVRRALVETQAEKAGHPLWQVALPSPCPNAVYENAMAAIWDRAVAEQCSHVAFGDLFLADVREYRERQLLPTSLTPLFPLWHVPTHTLARDMIQAGVKATLTCVDPSKLDRGYAGREFDGALLDSLPAAVDPCGENGEFHTFVHASPVFSKPIPVRTGETVERDGFVFTDVLPDERPSRVVEASAASPDTGLCATCQHVKTVISDRGSAFFQCLLSHHDPAFPRYPRLPVVSCSGWSPDLRYPEIQR